jgi:hypothetical protein
MEPEREPQRAKPTPKKTAPPSAATVQKTQLTKPTSTTSFLQKPIAATYAQEVSVIMGFAFLIIGLVGFVVTDLAQLHLGYAHSVIHFISGLLALWFGFSSYTAAKRFDITFGIIYGLLGLFGFAYGKPGTPSMGNMSKDAHLWKFIPEKLELGTTDHALHILIGVIFIAGAFLTFRGKNKTAR